MGRRSGIDSRINGIPCLQRWMIQDTDMDNAVACSSTQGGVVRAEANHDFNGAAVGFGYTPAMMPGDVFQFEGLDGDGEGWQSDATGCIVSRVTIFAEPQPSKLFYYHLYFTANGALTPGSYTPLGFSTPNPRPSVQRTIQVDGTPETGTTAWTLDIHGNLSKPVWESQKAGWPSRTVGNIDAWLTWNGLYSDPTAIPQRGAFHIFRADVTESTYYELSWMKVLQASGKYVIDDGESRPEYVNNDGVAKFSAVTDGTGSTVGHIKMPDGSTWWPF